VHLLGDLQRAVGKGLGGSQRHPLGASHGNRLEALGAHDGSKAALAGRRCGAGGNHRDAAAILARLADGQRSDI